jgi:hypothetical protein
VNLSSHQTHWPRISRPTPHRSSFVWRSDKFIGFVLEHSSLIPSFVYFLWSPTTHREGSNREGCFCGHDVEGDPVGSFSLRLKPVIVMESCHLCQGQAQGTNVWWSKSTFTVINVVYGFIGQVILQNLCHEVSERLLKYLYFLMLIDREHLKIVVRESWVFLNQFHGPEWDYGMNAMKEVLWCRFMELRDHVDLVRMWMFPSNWTHQLINDMSCGNQNPIHRTLWGVQLSDS